MTRRRSMVCATTLALALAGAAAARPPTAPQAPDPQGAREHVRALERYTERAAARLGLAPTPSRPLSTAPAALEARGRALGTVALFLDARREVVRSRIRAPRPVRPRGASRRADVVRHVARLGLDRLALPRHVAARDPRRWRDIDRWLAARAERLRDAEQPLTRPVRGPLTSPFGLRWARAHEGLDIGGADGTPIHAAASGVVSSAGSNAGYGEMVVLRHAGGLRTAYAHLSAVSVRPGRAVAQGQVVGRMGSTGQTTGTHLHFETRVGGRAVDPAPYLRDAGRAVGSSTIRP